MRWSLVLGVLWLFACAKAVSAPVDPVVVAAPIERVAEELDWSALPKVVSGRAPILLEAPDGTAMPLWSVDVRGVVEGPLALTELHLAFTNPLPRRIEGRLSVVLPEGASIGRLAMSAGDTYQEAELVEKAKATSVYEQYLHQRVDPALLDQDLGNRFAVRVFPIEASSTKRIVISYTEELVGDYRVRLAGLDALERFTLRVHTSDRVLSFDELDFAPDRDFVLAPEADAIRVGDVLVARVTAPPAAVDGGDEATVLVDTSASMDLATLQPALRKVLAGLTEVRVVAFDQDTEEIHRGKASDFDPERLAKRGTMGATDLVGALRSLPRTERLIVLTDGVSTLGQDSASAVQAALEAVPGLERVQAVPVGDTTNAALLDTLTLGRGPALPIAVHGSTWSWPDRVQPGKTVVVYAEAPPDAKLGVSVGGERVAVEPAAGDVALANRARSVARIKALIQQRESAVGQAREKLQRAIVRASLRDRVLTRWTSFLVLETEEDYRLHRIDRRAPGNILVVGDDGPEVWFRTEDSVMLGGGSQGRAGDVDPTFGGDALPEAPKRVIVVESEIRVVERIMFKAGSAKILKLSHGLLEEIAQVLKDNPGLRVEVQGHTDSRGDAHANLRLSEQRARAVVKFLVDHGVDGRRLVARGYGETRPLAANTTEDGRERNRRVEFQIIGRPDFGRKRPMGDPYRGEVKKAFASGEGARAYWAKHPRDRVALLALGRTLEGKAAARVYGSLIDLNPTRVEDVRTAAVRLEALGFKDAALAAYERAVSLRPDHVTGKQMLDRAHGIEPSTSLRFILTWESDTTDVDLRITPVGRARDAMPCTEATRDVRTGYGPECWMVDKPGAKDRYEIAVHYANQASMGPAIGNVQEIHPDGTATHHPFVITESGGFLELGTSR